MAFVPLCSSTVFLCKVAGCHNSMAAKPAGGLALDNLKVQAAAEHPEIWEKAIRKLRGRLMPFYEAGRREASGSEAQARQRAASSNDSGTFDKGVERLVAAVLASLEFLYRAKL
jgi:hypothetical protein